MLVTWQRVDDCGVDGNSGTAVCTALTVTGAVRARPSSGGDRLRFFKWSSGVGYRNSVELCDAASVRRCCMLVHNTDLYRFLLDLFGFFSPIRTCGQPFLRRPTATQYNILPRHLLSIHRVLIGVSTFFRGGGCNRCDPLLDISLLCFRIFLFSVFFSLPFFIFQRVSLHAHKTLSFCFLSLVLSLRFARTFTESQNCFSLLSLKVPNNTLTAPSLYLACSARTLFLQNCFSLLSLKPIHCQH